MTTQTDFESTSKDLYAYAAKCEDRILSGTARKLAGYFMLLATTEEPGTAADTQADIATEYPKFLEQVAQQGGGQ